MKKDESILQELKEIDSALATIERSQGYSVPAGYFEELPNRMLARIKALDTEDAREEIALLSPLLAGLSRKLPFSVPEGYFNEFTDAILFATTAEEDPGKELFSIAPVLSGIKKENPFTVPAGYFENVNASPEKAVKKSASVFALGNRVWKYAAAAVVVSVIAISAFLFTHQQSGTESDASGYAWIEKNMKKVSTNDIDDFLSLAEVTVPNTNTASGQDVQALVKNVSDKEIQDFLNDVGGDNVEDILN